MGTPFPNGFDNKGVDDEDDEPKVLVVGPKGFVGVVIVVVAVAVAVACAEGEGPLVRLETTDALS